MLMTIHEINLKEQLAVTNFEIGLRHQQAYLMNLLGTLGTSSLNTDVLKLIM